MYDKCLAIIGTLDTRSMLVDPTPEIMALDDEAYAELESSHGQDVTCDCPLILPHEIEARECIFCRWDRENARFEGCA